jgi:hypothetical protein
MIESTRELAAFDEPVLVNPGPVRSTPLDVNEAIGWLPSRDLALPAHGYASNPELVLD